MRSSLLLLSLFALGGCPDPSAPSDAPATDAPPGAGGGDQGPGGGPGGAGGAGGGAPQPPPIGNMKFEVTPGEGVKLSGTISYTGTKTGAIHIDFLKPGENGSFPSLLDSLTVEKAGPWEVEAPKGLGKVGIVGYVDVAGDGPNDGDPAARVPDLVDIQAAALSGLDLALSDTPDLGEFTPGKGDKGPAPGGPGGAAGAPPDGAGGAGAGAPPPGGAPPDGAAPAAGAPPPGGAPPAGAPPAGAPPAAGAPPG